MKNIHDTYGASAIIKEVKSWLPKEETDENSALIYPTIHTVRELMVEGGTIRLRSKCGFKGAILHCFNGQYTMRPFAKLTKRRWSKTNKQPLTPWFVTFDK